MCEESGFCSSASVHDTAAVPSDTGLHPSAKRRQISPFCSFRLKLNTANSRSGTHSFWKLKWSFPCAQFWFPEHKSDVCSAKRWPTQAGHVPTGFEGFFNESRGQAWLQIPEKSFPSQCEIRLCKDCRTTAHKKLDDLSFCFFTGQ